MLEIQRKLARLRKLWADIRGSSGQTYVHDRVSEYRDIWHAVAEEIGADFSVLDDRVYEIARGDQKIRILNFLLPFDNPVTLEIAGMKPLVYRLLAENGLPVPPHEVFRLDGWQEAGELLKKHPMGVVVKPATGTSAGKGVTTHILTSKELRKAAILASLYCRELIVEAMIPGECYRLLVLDGKVVHAVRRTGPRLVGDGITNILDLIKLENEHRKERQEDLLDIDRDTTFTLGYQYLSLDSVPARGQNFLVKSVNDPVRKRVEVRTVYNETVTDIVSDSLKATAETVARLIGSRLVGVDMITTDPTVSLQESGGVVNEANTTPGMHHHYDISKEKYPLPAVQAVTSLLSR
ncbi:MAG: hypothetical protein JSV52_12650 [Candidatus Zixiibacteriota bacterium]|nr:MAG: hypothetical protein JSV52_12650 [candidate division Zixibacteria bacterium]